MAQIIDKELLDQLFEQAVENPRKRTNYDMRTSPEDSSQRMLNAMLPGTEVAVHRHPNSNENVVLITGKMYEILYEVADGQLVETERLYLCPAEGKYGCQVPKGVWHTVEVIEPSVIYEAKDGKYGEDGSEPYEG
jgi:cupin fold WbuC family metalloprotein